MSPEGKMYCGPHPREDGVPKYWDYERKEYYQRVQIEERRTSYGTIITNYHYERENKRVTPNNDWEGECGDG